MSGDHSSPILFSGSSNQELAKEICAELGWRIGELTIERFPDGEVSLRVRDNVRGKKVFIVQSIALQPNEYLVELLLAVDAIKRAAASEIIAVIPYYGYCRQDRRDLPRVPISARLVANLLETAGVTQVLTMDLHAKQLQGFFNIPVDELHARPKLVQPLNDEHIENWVIVAPDVGGSKMARDFAAHLGCGLVITEKQRDEQGKVKKVTLIGSVAGKDVLLADDMCTTGGTLALAAKACQEKGARRILAAVTHGLFVHGALQQIEESPIEAVIVGNTVPLSKEVAASKKILPISLATLFARAIQRIIAAESLTSLTQ